MKGNRETFIEKALIVHQGENLDYSRVVYVNNRTPVEIIDHDLRPDGTEYGSFWQTPSNHLKGQCHPDKRSLRISKSKMMKQEDVIARLVEKYKDEDFDFSDVDYNGAHSKVTVKSEKYGTFVQEANALFRGHTCKEHGKDRFSNSMKLTQEEYIEKVSSRHCDKNYDFSKVKYIDSRSKVEVICPKHGSFWINADNLMQGKGCPHCGYHTSKKEKELYDRLKEWLPDDEIIRNYRKDGHEIDLYVPSYKLGIEYNGLRWHTEQFKRDRNYHLNKLLYYKDNGIRLIQIFEDEYINHKDIVIDKIRYNLRLERDIRKIPARKCNISKIDKNTAEIFLSENHIQGFVKSSIYLGAYYKDELVGVMTFTEESEKMWNLTRYATKLGTSCQGLANKMFSYFKRNYEFIEVKSFLDRRWCWSESDNIYIKMGFCFDSYVKPDYRYYNPAVDRNKRFHKFGFRKAKLLKMNSDFTSDMTELEMTKALGYERIWDCGLIKYVYRNIY